MPPMVMTATGTPTPAPILAACPSLLGGSAVDAFGGDVLVIDAVGGDVLVIDVAVGVVGVVVMVLYPGATRSGPHDDMSVAALLATLPLASRNTPLPSEQQ